MKKTFVFIYLVIFVIASVGTTSYFLYDIFANSNKVLTIELEDNQSSDIKLSIKDFYPGKKEEKIIKVSTDCENIKLTSIFNFPSTTSTMLEYLDLKVTAANETLCSGELKKAGFNVEFDNSIELNFEYSMALTIGNEAQGTELDYTITFEVEAR